VQAGHRFQIVRLYNFSLLACFAGLGLGYALGSQRLIPLFLSVPLFCWQFLVLLGMRYGLSMTDRVSLRMLPFTEPLNRGLPVVGTLVNGLQTYLVLSLVFLLTALSFVPIGQLCGCLLERREKLSAYGLNLAGSIAGVLVLFILSAFWTPPVVWFLIAFAVLRYFTGGARVRCCLGSLCRFGCDHSPQPADRRWKESTRPPTAGAGTGREV
jgi:hypothetical protein